MSGNRLLIATLVLAALLGLTFFMFSSRESEDSSGPAAGVKLPKLTKDGIDTLELSVPGKQAVTLVKEGKLWKLTKPLAADADQNAVDAALSKLAELEVTGTAATKADNYKKLEVDDAQGTHVVAKQAGKVLVDVVIGTYRSGNTMLRKTGEVNVATVKGSIKFAFDKDVKDWRDRTITDLEPEKLKSVQFQNANGVFNVELEGTAWKQTPGDKPIVNFDSEATKTLISNATHLSAADFAPIETSADAAGVGATPIGTVTLTPSDANAKPIVLHVGQKLDTNFYVTREGMTPIFLVASYGGERLLPSGDKFAKAEPAAAPAGAPGMPPGMQGMPPGMQVMQGTPTRVPGMPAAGGKPGAKIVAAGSAKTPAANGGKPVAGKPAAAPPAH